MVVIALIAVGPLGGEWKWTLKQSLAVSFYSLPFWAPSFSAWPQRQKVESCLPKMMDSR